MSSIISHNPRVSGLKEGWSYWKYGVLWTVGEGEEVEITNMLRRRKGKENQWKGLSCIKWMFDGKIRRHFIPPLVQLLPLDIEISLCNKSHYRKTPKKRKRSCSTQPATQLLYPKFREHCGRGGRKSLGTSTTLRVLWYYNEIELKRKQILLQMTWPYLFNTLKVLQNKRPLEPILRFGEL